MRAWQEKLPESQRKILQEIVEQIPTTMGVREAIEGILDNLTVQVVDLPNVMSVSDVYDTYVRALNKQGVSADEFGDLEPSDQHAWGEVANLVDRNQPFRFIVCKDGDVTGTNDGEVARSLAEQSQEDDTMYVIDVIANLWMLGPDASDDSAILEHGS